MNNGLCEHVAMSMRWMLQLKGRSGRLGGKLQICSNTATMWSRVTQQATVFLPELLERLKDGNMETFYQLLEKEKNVIYSRFITCKDFRVLIMPSVQKVHYS